MKSSRLLTTLFALVLGLSMSAYAQPETGSIGIRANVTGQATLELPYMLNEDLSLAPAVSFSTTENQSTTIAIGVRPRYYMGMNNSLATYATGNLGFNNTSVSGANTSSTNFNLGVGYGAEYFFSNAFSVSADLNLNSRFGDSNTTLSTGARVSASIYF